MSDRFAAHLPAIRNLPARTRLFAIGAAAVITIGAAVAIPALLAPAARPGTAVFTGLPYQVYSVAFSPDGKILASASRDGTVRLWDVASHRQIGNPLAGHTGQVYSVAFSPDGKTLATASEDRTVRLWDVASHRQIGNPLAGHAAAVNSVAFSPDGKTLAGADGHGVRLWDLATGRQIGDLPTGHNNWVDEVAFSPDGKTLAGGGGYGLRSQVWLWDLATGRPISQRLTSPDGGIGAVAFSPDGKILATGSEDGTVRLWDVTTGHPIKDLFTGHTNRVYSLVSVAFSPDGKTLASCGISGPVRLWDVATGGGTTAAGPPANGTTATTNGLENKSPAEVLRAAAAALGAVKSVHIVGADLDGHFDVRMQRGSAIVTITYPRTGGHARFRVIGRYGYAMTDFGHNADRWLRYPAQAFKEFTLGEYAPFGYRPHGAKVQQATVNGKKVVVLSWPDGSKFQVANTGPAYPLRAKFKGGYPAWVVFSEYNVPFDVTAPSNSIDYRQAG